jgi:hypothetical protein
MILKAKRAVGTSRGGRSGGLQIKMDRQRHPRLKVMSSRSVGDWYTGRHDEDSSDHFYFFHAGLFFADVGRKGVR